MYVGCFARDNINIHFGEFPRENLDNYFGCKRNIDTT